MEKLGMEVALSFWYLLEDVCNAHLSLAIGIFSNLYSIFQVSQELELLGGSETSIQWMEGSQTS